MQKEKRFLKMIEIKDDLLEEKNVIQDYSDTFFYLTIACNPIRYGVAVNIKDIDKMQEIIDEFKQRKKEQIEAWNEEQRKRNFKEEGAIPYEH